VGEVYGSEVSKQTIPTITDRVLDGMSEWQNRPPDAAWVQSEIKNRGTRGVWMVVCDGLTGLPEAIGQVWPAAAITQTCIVHLCAPADAIDSLNARIRRAVNARGHFPAEQAS
jgi:putative transposase